ncbi:MAG: hypothetical protein R3C56_40055 [Pirellulaceae bacterium]
MHGLLAVRAQVTRAIAGLVGGMRFGSEHAIDDEIAGSVFPRDRVAIENDVEQAQYHIASAIGQARSGLGVLRGS